MPKPYHDNTPLTGAGLGLRRSMLSMCAEMTTDDVQFMEVAPENWMRVGGRYGKAFKEYAERFPMALHGLSLNIGGPQELDFTFLNDLKTFITQHNCPFYSEHLTFCADDGHLYDLMPIPFTEGSVKYVAERVRIVQDVIGQRIALENASYYAAPQQEMSEIDFVNAVISEADCDLLLDVNNIYVNSINHGYDAQQFLAQLPGDRATYIHVAGHFEEADDLRVDTHGANVIDPVWELLDAAYKHFGVLPTLLERDFNIPELSDLLLEVDQIKTIQRANTVSAKDEHVA